MIKYIHGGRGYRITKQDRRIYNNNDDTHLQKRRLCQLQNYRPLSVLFTQYKIYERTLYFEERPRKENRRNNKYTQAAFRADKST